MSNEFLRNFDGLQSRTIFCLWTGDELMSENRLKALWSLFKNTACPVAFITKETISEWVHPDYPLHPAFQYLSSTHKSDYLRCYLMHLYGGGYADIKMTRKSWVPFFSKIQSSDDAFALGYQELPHGIPHVQGETGDVIRAAHKELIGLCAFIFKSKSAITSQWYSALNMILERKLEALIEDPGRHPLDQYGVTLPNGKSSSYPLRWAEILGEILHPLLYKHREKLLQSDIEPIFNNYR